MMHWTRAFCLALCSGSLFACVDDDEGPANATDASIDAPRPDAAADTGVRGEAGLEAGEDAGTVVDASIDAEAGAEGGSEQDSGASDASDGPNPEGGAAGPAIWLAYIADRTPDVDELWAVRVHNSVAGAPVRVNAPLAPNQNVTWMRWTDDGKQLAYRIGTEELFVVDMTGSAPAAPKYLDDVGATEPFGWSANGKYLAYFFGGQAEVRVVDLSQPTLTARSVSLCPSASAANCLLPAGHPDPLQWSADSEWLFGQSANPARLSEDVVLWGVHVRDGALDPPTALFTVPYGQEIVGFAAAPSFARVAVTSHIFGSGFFNYITTLTPQGVGPSTSAHPELSFWGWLAHGEVAYFLNFLRPPCSSPCPPRLGDSYLTGCGESRIFDTAGTLVSWKPAPNGATLAIVADDPSPSSAALYLRRRGVGSSQPCWHPLTAAVSDFSAELIDNCGTRACELYEWAPDSRNLLYAKSSLYVLDTAGSPLPAPRELAGSIPAGATATSIAWGRSSNRIFYTTSNSLGLNYIDDRAPMPQPSAILTPGFAHTAGDAVAWALSPSDSYVASKGDFSADGVFELYVTSVAGNRPEAPQRVNAAFSATQDVTAFAWQPVIVTVP